MAEQKKTELPNERLALAGAPMPEGLEMPEQMLYQALASLYGRFRANLIDKESAAKEKQAIADAYHWYKKDFETSYAWIWILHNVEIAVSTCRKDPTPENALALCEVLEGRKKDIGESENAIAQRYKRLMESMGREVM